MNDDMNLAAWMIAGGPTIADPTEARARTHRQAIALSLTSAGRRLAAQATTAVARRARPSALTLTAASSGSGVRIDPACCAA